MDIDINFDFRSDSGGRDPDNCSPTLRRYHRFLWSKALPTGPLFYLSDEVPSVYLHHRSPLGEFSLTSDSVIQTFERWTRVKPIIDQIPKHDLDEFMRISYTIGGMMIFPGNTVNRQPTINGARGLTHKIADRMDLTLECIRLHYRGADSPLASTLARYADFFSLFSDFRGYVSFFLLDDLVSEDQMVNFFMPFSDFTSPSIPYDIATYNEFRRRSINFVEARNSRIRTFADGSWTAPSQPCLPANLTQGGRGDG